MNPKKPMSTAEIAPGPNPGTARFGKIALVNALRNRSKQTSGNSGIGPVGPPPTTDFDMPAQG